MSTLLLGMGNPILSDDAVGVRLATDFACRLAGCPNLEFLCECSVGGLNLIDVLRGYSRVIVLDSLRTSGGVPGRWYSFDAEALRETLHLTNVHDANFATALELGRRLGIPLPEPSSVHIFAVEVQDATTFSERMTRVLEDRYRVYSAEIFLEVQRLLGLRPLREGRRSAYWDERSGRAERTSSS